jgi:kinesin family protein 6/9
MSNSDGNIQVFLRVRPSKNPSGYFQHDDLEKDRINFNLPDNFRSSDYINNSKLKYSFQFNGIVDASASQEDVFKRVGVNAVKNAIDGFNSTIFAYGNQLCFYNNHKSLLPIIFFISIFILALLF